MSRPDLERRLRKLLFDARANGIEDIVDPALQAEAGFLAHEIEQQRVNLTAMRREQSRVRFDRARAGVHARRREQRDRKAQRAHELRAEGLSNREIAKRLDICRRHVSRLCNQYVPPPDMKRCAHCGQVLPPTEETP